MNKIGLFAGLCLIFVFCAFLVVAHIDNDHDLKSYYKNCIDKKIRCCEKRALWWDSKYRNINSCAIISMIKATYFKENKRWLIKGMYENNIGKKQYKVDQFLNEKFFEAFRSSAVKNYMTVDSHEDDTIL